MTPEQVIYLADKTVAMTSVLDLNNFSYRGVPSQIPCPIHKSGQEKRLSARIYPDNFVWCFTCARQFTPTEIHSAFRSISRSAAAAELLSKFPVPSERQSYLLRQYRTPPKVSLPTALLNRLRESLLQFKHQVPLEPYLIWVRRIFDLKLALQETSSDHHALKVQVFRHQMEQELLQLQNRDK
jgi:hypothetical protein